MTSTKNELAQFLFQNKYHNKKGHYCRQKIRDFATQTLGLLFPQMGITHYLSVQDLEEELENNQQRLFDLIECLGINLNKAKLNKNKLIDHYWCSLKDTEKQLTQDAEFMAKEDPAAESIDEVILCYPGFQAIAIYRIAHILFQLELPLLPRVLTEYAHELTGIDIHPGAKIDSPFFIDHGTGIVIGETCEIGKNVKIFQGVTLGALSVERRLRKAKRHPTIKEGAVIYSNASILGGETIIGEKSIVGGNVWLTESVPDFSTVYHKSEIKLQIQADSSKD
jgi:serine O-acetyltransferase